uniref:Uncharacterized protein n=1 Tax=Ralstonia solanacearum TaxID=305 RepID=A0A0S4TYM0_RALSL|nr:protein of unknown function [Ralstonia solanacearum]
MRIKHGIRVNETGKFASPVVPGEQTCLKLRTMAGSVYGALTWMRCQAREGLFRMRWRIVGWPPVNGSPGPFSTTLASLGHLVPTKYWWVPKWTEHCPVLWRTENHLAQLLTAIGCSAHALNTRHAWRSPDCQESRLDPRRCIYRLLADEGLGLRWEAGSENDRSMLGVTALANGRHREPWRGGVTTMRQPSGPAEGYASDIPLSDGSEARNEKGPADAGPFEFGGWYRD